MTELFEWVTNNLIQILFQLRQNCHKGTRSSRVSDSIYNV